MSTSKTSGQKLIHPEFQQSLSSGEIRKTLPSLADPTNGQEAFGKKQSTFQSSETQKSN